MASSLKKTANALSQESELLNVYSDLKAVCSKFDSFLGATESSQKRILNWAERKVHNIWLLVLNMKRMAFFSLLDHSCRIDSFAFLYLGG